METEMEVNEQYRARLNQVRDNIQDVFNPLAKAQNELRDVAVTLRAEARNVFDQAQAEKLVKELRILNQARAKLINAKFRIGKLATQFAAAHVQRPAKPITCPGCSGKTEDFDGAIKRCVNCGGLIGENLSKTDTATIEKHVLLGKMTNTDGPLQYFDFSGVNFDGSGRIHGWFDPQSKKVVQYG